MPEIQRWTNERKEVKPKTFFLLLQVGGHQVMKEHDELSVHGDADVVGEFGHHAALHYGLAAGIWNKYKQADMYLNSSRKENVR